MVDPKQTCLKLSRSETASIGVVSNMPTYPPKTPQALLPQITSKPGCVIGCKIQTTCMLAKGFRLSATFHLTVQAAARKHSSIIQGRQLITGRERACYPP